MGGIGVRRHLPSAIWAALILAGCTCDDQLKALSEGSAPPLGAVVYGGVSCDGEPVELSAVAYGGAAPYEYRWSPADGLSDPTIADPVALAERSREYTLTLIDAHGREARITARVERRAPPTVDLRFVEGAQASCDGDGIVIDASGSRDATGAEVASFRWDLGPELGIREHVEATTPRFTAADGQRIKLTAIDDAGCSNTVERQLTVHALPTAEARFTVGAAEVCAGDQVTLDGSPSRDGDGNPVQSFAWDLDGYPDTIEATASSSGAFEVKGPVRLTVTDRHGCQAATDVGFVINSLPTARVSFAEGASMVCAGEGVVLDAAASSDAAGNPVQAYRWDLDGNPATVEAEGARTPRMSPAGTQTIALTVVDANGCSDSTTASVSAVPLPTAQIALLEGRVDACQGEEVLLDGSGSTGGSGRIVTSYAWDLDGDGRIDAATAQPPRFSAVSGQTASLTVSNDFGCSATARQTFGAQEAPRVLIDFVEGGSVVCEGGTVALDGSRSRDANGNPVVAYEWNLDDDPLTIESRAATTGSFAPTGAATLTVIDARGCRAMATKPARADAKPPVVDAGPDRMVAANGSTQLLATASGGTGALRWEWTPAGNLDAAYVQRPRASPHSDTVYTATVTDDLSCSSSDTVLVQVTDALTVSAGPDQRLCLDGASGVTLTADVGGGVAPLRWSWTASPPCNGCIATPDAQTTTVSPQSPTTFTVTVTDDNGTTATSSVYVEVRPAFSVDAGPDRHVGPGETTLLGGTPQPGVDYQWSCSRTSCGLSDATDPNPLAAPRGTTLYTVTASDGASCRATDHVLVRMAPMILGGGPFEGHLHWPWDAISWVTFDVDIDPSSLPGNVYVLEPHTGRVMNTVLTWDAPTRTVFIDVTDRYRNNNPYLLVVKGGPGGIRSTGPIVETLYNDFTVQYNSKSTGDGAPPAIVWRHPGSFAANVPTTTHVVVQFDEPVDPRTINDGTMWIDGMTSEVSYDPRTWTATLRPHQSLAPFRSYVVRLDGPRDSTGNVTRTSWSFSTGVGPDTRAPQVTATSPAGGEGNVDAFAGISVTFDEPVDPVSFGGIRLVDGGSGVPLAGEIVYDERTRTATLTPLSFLDGARSYRLDVDAIQDQAGNELAVTYSGAFTTQSLLFEEKFEGGTTGWTLAPPWGLDYNAASAGEFGLSDSPGTDYAANASVSATSPAIDVRGRDSVAVSFWSRRTVAIDADRVHLDYSYNGTQWTTAGTLEGPTGWRLQSFTIPTLGRNSVRVRFRLTSNQSLQFDGWFIDELAVR